MIVVEHFEDPRSGLLHIAQFDSVYEFAHEADLTKNSTLANADEFGGRAGRISMFSNDRLSLATGYPTFAGGMEFDQAVQAAKSGCDYYREKVAEMTARIQTPASMGARSLQAKPLYGLSGGQVDVGRFLGGDPNCFRIWKRQITPNAGRVLTVVLPGAMSHTVTEQPVLIRGAVVCAFIDVAEAAGYRCEVWLNVASRKRMQTKGTQHRLPHREEHRIEYQVKLKRDVDPLDIDAISFALCHVAFARRLGFAHREDLPAVFRRQFNITEGGGYGVACETLMEGDINIPSLDSECFRNDDSAIEWLASKLEQIGVLEGGVE